MPSAVPTIGIQCHAGSNGISLERAALMILFIGGGMSVAMPFFAAHVAGDSLNWFVSRYSLLAALPALAVGVPCYMRCKGIAKSAPLICCVLWMAASLLWTDPTELGRGLLIFAAFAATLPLAALILRTDLHEECIFWFCTAFVVSLVIAVLCGMETVDGRMGDVVVDDVVVMNSNGLGCTAALVLLLIYGLYSTRRAGRESRRGLSASAYQIWLPCLTLGAGTLCAMSVSRTAAIALTASALVIVAWNVGRGRTIWIEVLAIPIVVGTLATTLGFFDSWTERFNDTDVASLNGRTDIWELGWEFMSTGRFNVVCGVGIGAADKSLARATGQGVVHPVDGIRRCHAHNQYLEWQWELGLIGAALGLWLAWTMSRWAWRRDQEEGTVFRRAFLAYLAVFGISGVILKMESWLAMGPLLWALLAPRPSGKETS
jgi:hypothetical protein